MPKRISAEEAARLVKSGMWLDFGSMMSQPDLFDRALAARKDSLEAVKIRSALTMSPRAVLEADPQGAHFQWYSWHFSGYDRKQHDAGRCNYIPMNFGELPGYYRRFVERVDIAILKCCPRDENGMFNFSGACTNLAAVIERADIVIVETSTTLPHVPGPENGVHERDVDYVIEGNDVPVPELRNPPASEIDHAIARLIAARVEDGACLQVGIGAMPNAVCSTLVESGVKDLGIHTEMMVDGIVDLFEAGRVTGAEKKLDPGKMVFCFAAGSKRLYNFIHKNPHVESHPVDYTNLPERIMQNDRVVSINSTTQIDLQGQAASESSGHRHISGTGGQLQFVRGAYASKGGQSFICLSSTYDKRGKPESRIVLDLTPGNIVTTPRTDVMFVATEYGLVSLKGKAVAERAKALISIAHPSFRETLERQAREANLIPRFC